MGNETFGDRALGTAILTRETECRSVAFQVLLLCPLGFSFAKDPHYLSPRELPLDLARIQIFYYQRGYRGAQVDTSVVELPDGRIELTFEIREGEPTLVERFQVLGLEELDDPELMASLPMRVGDPLSLLALDATRDTLVTRLRNRGYAHAEVLRNFFVPRDQPLTAEVEFDVFMGPRARFGAITISGNEKISDRVAARMLPFREGDVYSKERVFQGQRNLFGLEIVRHAEIREDLRHVPDSLVPLEVQVYEGDAHRVRAGAGFTTADCVTAESRWSSRNFYGGGRRLQVQGRISNLFNETLNRRFCQEAGSDEYGVLNALLSVDFVQPWFYSPRLSLSSGVYWERQSVKDIFVRNALGANLGLTRSLRRATPLTLSYRPQLSSLDAAESYFCSSFLVCDEDPINELQASNWLSPLGLSIATDRTNRVLNPSGGYTALLELEHAAGWTGSSFRYDRLIGEATAFAGLGRSVVATRVRAGWLGPQAFKGAADKGEIVNPQKRFYAGGANSVRGFAQNQLGPRALTISVDELVRPRIVGRDTLPPLCAPAEIVDRSCDAADLSDTEFRVQPQGGIKVLEGNVELRFPIYRDLAQGAAFLDFGQVWAERDPVRLSSLELSPGLGFRYLTPIGPVRFDVAYRFLSEKPLAVITDELCRVGSPGCLSTNDPIPGPDEAAYVKSGGLTSLDPRVLYGPADGFSFSRFQIHLSIGQAF